MKLDVDVIEIQQLRAAFAGFSDRRFAAAMATALSRTAVAVRQAEEHEILDVFDRPTPYTQRAIYSQPATAQNLEARVGVKDGYFAASGRAPVSYLRWQIGGGLRTQTGFERALVRGGAMDGGDRAVPGRFARLDAYGNMSRGQMAQILSQLRIADTQAGSTRNLPRLAFDDNARERRRKQGSIRRAYQRAGGEFVAFPYGRGKLRPGIYQIRATAFGRADPKPVVVFVGKAQYEAGRFDFFHAGDLAARRTLGPEVDRALADHTQRVLAKANGR